MPDDDLLSPREAARRFGISVKTLAVSAREGRLPAAFTPGGHRRYRLTDLRTFAAEREQRRPEPKKWENDAVRLYEQGSSIKQLAQKFGCGYGTMRRLLRNRTAIRTHGQAPRV